MNNNSPCLSCRYYKAHYAIDENGDYYDVNTGHCENTDIRKREFNRVKKYYGACGRPCRRYQPTDTAA